MTDHPGLQPHAATDVGGSLFVPGGPARLGAGDHVAGTGDGDGQVAWVPTDLARGPWSPDALHGGPVAALAARAVERCAPRPGLEGASVPMHVTRLTVELLRPVPLSPLHVVARVVRPGRRVQIVDVDVVAATRPVASARALRLRVDPGGPGPRRDAPAGARAGAGRAPFAGPDGSTSTRWRDDDYAGFYNAGAELRFAAGGFEQPGPAVAWVRLAVPVVPGEEPTPLQRLVAAADFGNGVGAVLPFDRYRFVNPDLTVWCLRPPAGEWIALQAETVLGVPGIGLAQSVLWDATDGGPVGRGFQSLVVERRSEGEGEGEGAR